MAPSKAFKDASTDCAICLSSLYEVDEENDESGEEAGKADGSGGGVGGRDRAEIIELSCGHVYHLECVREQLERARPTCHQRMLFSGTRCAKCARFCDHPALRDLTRPSDALREAVDRLVVEQLAADHPEYKGVLLGVGAPQGAEEEQERRHLIEQGRRSYAFYLCSSCRDPYFGGTVECADGDDAAARELPPADRLCPSCSPASQSVGCADPAEHRGHHVWKCRYCCQPGRYVCYGTTHFCEACHDRNSAAVRLQQQQGAPPPELEPVPCPGRGACPFPLPAGSDSHRNGPTPACEQVYGCAWCESRHPVAAEEPGSRNWIVNPSGGHGLRGWTQHNPHMSWQVEPLGIPLPGSGAGAAPTTATNFASSFQWCVQSQAVPLGMVLRQPARLEARCQFAGCPDCASVFSMEVQVIGRRRDGDPSGSAAPVLQRVALRDLETSPGWWETARIEIPGLVDPAVAEAVVLVVAGKDRRYWAGRFGSKVAECTIRVLGDGAELERVLRPDAHQRMEERERRLLLPPHPRSAERSTSSSCNIA